METTEEETKELYQKKKSSLTTFDLLNDAVIDAAFRNIWVLLHFSFSVRNSLWTWILKSEIDYDRSIDKATSYDGLPSKTCNWWSSPENIWCLAISSMEAHIFRLYIITAFLFHNFAFYFFCCSMTEVAISSSCLTIALYQITGKMSHVYFWFGFTVLQGLFEIFNALSCS